METEKKSHGALIGSIIIIIILLIGGMYVWQSKMKSDAVKKQMVQQQAALDAQNSQTTNDLNSLDQQINSTDANTGVDVNSIQ